MSYKYLRGLGRIRTAVKGFADLCLATRPRDPILLGMQKYKESTLKQIIELILIH